MQHNIIDTITFKIFHLYKDKPKGDDKPLSDRDLRKMTKKLLEEYEDNRVETSDKIIKMLSQEVNDFRTVKELLRGK